MMIRVPRAMLFCCLSLAVVQSSAPGAGSAPGESLPVSSGEQVEFPFPADFTFPFFGQSYSSVWVGADGFLAFGSPDTSGAPPSEPVFLAGPARIAVFMTLLDVDAGGEIQAQSLEGAVRVCWTDISRAGSAEASTFSATLFDTGDVLLRFESVSDVEPAELQAIVGVTPGGLLLEDTVGLRDEGRVFLLEDRPIYQVFEGASFDLEESAVFFQAARSELIFPIFDEGDGIFTGLAFENPSDRTSGLGVEVKDDDGERLPAPDNPTLVVLEPGEQVARLGFELIGGGLESKRRGWTRVNSSTADIAGFSLLGSVGDRGLTRLDGSLAGEATSDVYCFTRVYEGVQVYPTFSGALDATTTLAIANPNLNPVTLTLRLFNFLGQQLAERERIVEAGGRLFSSIEQIFERTSLGNHYVCVASDGGPTTGAELIELPDTIMVLAGATVDDAATYFSAQLAHSEAIYTSLKLTNPTTQPRALVLTAFLQGAGGVSQRVAPLTLQAGQAFQQTVSQIFGLGPGGTETVVGSIRVDTSPPGVLGDVIFGDPQTGEFAAALPLESRTLLDAVFSHVANGPTNVEEPSLDPFTGLAVFNPNPTAVDVTIVIHEPDSTVVGTVVVTLAARERFSQVLEVLVPESAELSAGFVRLKATGPVIAQQLFGNSTLQFLAAIPAQVLSSPPPE